MEEESDGQMVVSRDHLHVATKKRYRYHQEQKQFSHYGIIMQALVLITRTSTATPLHKVVNGLAELKIDACVRLKLQLGRRRQS